MTTLEYAETFPFPNKKLLSLQEDLLEARYPIVKDMHYKDRLYIATQEEIEELEKSFHEAY